MWLSQDVDSRDVFTTFLHDRGRFRACSIWFTCISSSILLSSCRVIALPWSLLLGRFRYSVTMADWAGNYNFFGPWEDSSVVVSAPGVPGCLVDRTFWPHLFTTYNPLAHDHRRELKTYLYVSRSYDDSEQSTGVLSLTEEPDGQRNDRYVPVQDVRETKLRAERMLQLSWFTHNYHCRRSRLRRTVT